MHNSRSDTRAASEVMGYILIFSLIFTTVGIVSLAGLPTLDSARESQQLQNAERAFDVLNSNMIEVYERGAPSRATELSADDGTVETKEAVTFNVTAEHPDGYTNSTVAEINPIVFTGFGKTEFVYEAGAVIRHESSGGIMLRDPPFRIGEERIFTPLVATNSGGVQSTGGGTVLVRAASERRSVEIAQESTQLNITVSNSDYQDVWQTYFEEEAGMDSCSSTSTELDCGIDLTETPTHVTIQEIAITLEV